MRNASSLGASTLTILPLALSLLTYACGASSDAGTGADGGSSGATATSSTNAGGVVNRAAGGTTTLGSGGATRAAGGKVSASGGAGVTTVNPNCVADGTCTGNSTCQSACQNDTALSFTCNCTNGVYVCDTAVCLRPNPCRNGGTCTTDGETCTAACPAISGNPSGSYSCTCAAARGGFGTNNLAYGNCTEATGCVTTCAEGAQTAGARCTAVGTECVYTNTSGTTVTCTCGGGRGGGFPGVAGAGAFNEIWTCR
jgi:hypothetical protein